MNLEPLPLAVTMMAGPAIMAAIILVTSPRAARVSLAYLVGVAVGTTVGTAIALGLLGLLGENLSLGDSSDSGSAGKIIQIALVLLLIAAALKNWRGRETIEPPKWLGSLLEANVAKAFVVGLLVILLGPSDIVVMFTVGANLEHHDLPLSDALPFIAATVLVAALPLIGFLVFHRRAVRAMPKVRDWVNANSWLVNIGVCVIFIILIL